MKTGQKLENSKLNSIKTELDALEINESICRIEIMKKYYIIDGGWLDEFNDNNFRVVLTLVRKLMPDKVFRTINKRITRIK